LSQTFAALSDPTRRAMLARLMQGEATVNELAAPFKMSLPAISKHIKVLEKAGLLIKTRQAQQRPCKINGEQFRLAMAWFEQYRQLWEGRPDRLDASQPAGTPGKAKPRAEKRVRSSPGAEEPKRAKRNKSPTKEKKDDNTLQQQIGFEF
jgi:DNA-binding transcriptional ArsR family regulator